ncbi:MAG: hypothetical protein R3C68_12640 [Myxococcota bacterium]
MSVNIYSIKALENGSITKPGSITVHLAAPEGHGKIKSPMCCGQDMSCDI